jgi:hypothetical protein
MVRIRWPHGRGRANNVPSSPGGLPAREIHAGRFASSLERRRGRSSPRPGHGIAARLEGEALLAATRMARGENFGLRLPSEAGAQQPTIAADGARHGLRALSIALLRSSAHNPLAHGVRSMVCPGRVSSRLPFDGRCSSPVGAIVHDGQRGPPADTVHHHGATTPIDGMLAVNGGVTPHVDRPGPRHRRRQPRVARDSGCSLATNLSRRWKWPSTPRPWRADRMAVRALIRQDSAVGLRWQGGTGGGPPCNDSKNCENAFEAELCALRTAEYNALPRRGRGLTSSTRLSPKLACYSSP